MLLKLWWVLGLLAAACGDDAELRVQPERAEEYRRVNVSNTSTSAESGDVEGVVRFVAFGDVDGSDGISSGMVPNVSVAVIKDDEVSDWWKSVAGIEDYISPTYFIPPGVQVQSSSGGISAAPVSFITTGLDGTAETVLRFDSRSRSIDMHMMIYMNMMICAVSPVDETLIAGCSQIEYIWLPSSLDITFYIYFSDGRAYIDRNSERYQRFIDETSASEDDPGAIATVAFVSIVYSDIRDPRFLRNGLVAIVEDEDIGNWWETISDNELFSDGHGMLFLDSHQRIWFDPRIIGNMPIRIVNTGYDAIAEIEIEPGDYLLCEVERSIGGCIYEYIAASQTYEYEISSSGEGGFYMGRQSPGYVERHLIDSQDWEFHG